MYSQECLGSIKLDNLNEPAIKAWSAKHLRAIYLNTRVQIRIVRQLSVMHLTLEVDDSTFQTLGSHSSIRTRLPCWNTHAVCSELQVQCMSLPRHKEHGLNEKEVNLLRMMLLSIACIFGFGYSSSNKSTEEIPIFTHRVFTGPWSMDSTALEKFKSSANAINLGDSGTRVIQLLGRPDADKTVAKGEKLRLFEYYAARQRAETALDSDPTVIVVLDSSQSVKRICSTAVGVLSKNCKTTNGDDAHQ